MIVVVMVKVMITVMMMVMMTMVMITVVMMMTMVMMMSVMMRVRMMMRLTTMRSVSHYTHPNHDEADALCPPSLSATVGPRGPAPGRARDAAVWPDQHAPHQRPRHGRTGPQHCPLRRHPSVAQQATPPPPPSPPSCLQANGSGSTAPFAIMCSYPPLFDSHSPLGRARGL